MSNPKTDAKVHSKVNGKSFLVGAVVGSVLGAVTALLVAPKSGRELRRDIADQARNVTEKTHEIAGTIGRKTQEIAGSVGRKTTQIAKTFGSATSEWAGLAKETAGNAVGEVKAWKEARQEAAPTLEAAEEESKEGQEAVRSGN